MLYFFVQKIKFLKTLVFVIQFIYNISNVIRLLSRRNLFMLSDALRFVNSFLPNCRPLFILEIISDGAGLSV